MQNLKTNLDYALYYNSIGWNLFPVAKGTKDPIVEWKIYQTEKVTEEQIRSWWAMYPDANIGVLAGTISGIVVLDIDAKHGRSSSEFIIPVTVSSNTGGGGEHFIFKYPKYHVRNSNGTLFGAGIDIKGEGGYFVVPPSLHKSGVEYEWKGFCTPFDVDIAEVPDWLEKALLEQNKNDNPRLYETPQSEVEEGTRNSTAISVAGKIISATPEELRKSLGWKKFVDWNSGIPSPLTEKELKTVWKSACSYNNKDYSKLLQKKEAKIEMGSKPEYKTTYAFDNYLYEMVYDKKLDKTYYIRCDSKGNLESGIEKITHGQREYIPLPPNHMLVSKGVVLFPSGLSPYFSEKELLGEIRAFIHKYVDISEEFEVIASYYALLTWKYDKFYELPYLRLRGDYGTGKTRGIKTVGSISYKPIFTGGATTPSPVFRIIDEIGGTLVLDEADFSRSDMTSEIVKILNSGYQKGSPVLRSEGKGVFEVKAYEVFCPKIIATRESFADNALESRFLVEEMGKNTLRDDIPRETRSEFDEEALQLRNKLLQWRFDNYFIEVEKKNTVIKGIHPRLNQIVLPLLSIIKDKDVEEDLINFIIRYNEDLVADRGLSRESDIIFAIFKLELSYFKKNILTIKEIANEVNKLIDDDDKDGKLHPRKAGWYLRKKLQLKSEKTRIGYVLNIEQNRDKLNFWKERFGITDAEVRGEHGSIIDVDNIADQIMENNNKILR